MSKNVIGELIYKFSGDMSALTSAIKSSETAVKGMGDKVNQSFASQTASIFKGVAGWDLLKTGVQEATAIIKEGVTGAIDDLRQVALTKSILEKQGLAWDEVGAKVEAFGDKMLQMGIDDESANLQVARFSQRLGGDLTKAFNMATLASNLSASGFGTFEEVSSDLEKVIAGKGTKALIKYGVALKDNATITEQLNAITGKVTITAEEYANSTEGQMKKLTLASEEIKNAFGKGVVVAFNDTLTKMGILTEDMILNKDAMKNLSKFAYQLANTLLSVGLGAKFSLDGINGLTKSLAFLSSKALSGVFAGLEMVAKGFNALGVDNGDRVKELEALKESWSGASDVLANELAVSAEDTGKTFEELSSSIKKFFGEGFDEAMTKTEEANSKLGAVKQTTDEMTQSEIDATAEAEKMADSQKTAFEEMQNSVLGAKNKVLELTDSIKTKLTEAFVEFRSTMGDTVKEGANDLADIVIGAEKNIKEYKDQLVKEQAKSSEEQSADTIETLKKQISDEEKILTASSSFKTELATKLAEKQKVIDDLLTKSATETDPAKKAILETEIEARTLALDQLKGLGSLDADITEARRISNLDEFTAYQEQLFKKIDLATEAFITETTQLREKLELSKSVETEITNYLSSQTQLRQATLDAFAIATSATLSKIGADAKSAMDSLNSLQSLQSRISGATGGASTGTGKALGGYTVGGEYVHPNEYVIPSWIVNAMPSLVSNIEKMRTGGGVVNTKNISAPITVNAQMDGNADAGAIGRELGWELGRI